MKKRRRKARWSKTIRKYIVQEIRANTRKAHKRPWKQVVKIGLERARKAGVHVPAKKLRQVTSDRSRKSFIHHLKK